MLAVFVALEAKSASTNTVVEKHEGVHDGQDVVSINLAATAASYRGTAVFDKAWIVLKSTEGKIHCKQRLAEANECNLFLGKDVHAGSSRFLVRIFSEDREKASEVEHFSHWLQFDVSNHQEQVTAPKFDPKAALKEGSRWIGSRGSRIAQHVALPLNDLGNLAKDQFERSIRKRGSRIAQHVALPLNDLGSLAKDQFQSIRERGSRIAQHVARPLNDLGSLAKDQFERSIREKKQVFYWGALALGHIPIVMMFPTLRRFILDVLARALRSKPIATRTSTTHLPTEDRNESGGGGRGGGGGGGAIIAIALAGVAAAVVAGVSGGGRSSSSSSTPTTTLSLPFASGSAPAQGLGGGGAAQAAENRQRTGSLGSTRTRGAAMLRRGRCWWKEFCEGVAAAATAAAASGKNR